MQYPYYEFSVVVFIKCLSALSHLLDKASELAVLKGGEEAVLEAKLAPDMFSFIRQIRIATDNAKGASARLAGIEIPVMEDTETAIAELKVRIEKTIAFLKTLKPEQFREAGTRKVELKHFEGKYMTGEEYIKEYALPNFFFHMTTAYDILRMLGAPLRKADFMNGLPLKNN